MAQDPQGQQQDKLRTQKTISSSEVKGLPSLAPASCTTAAASYEDFSSVQPENLSPRTSMGGGLGRPIFPTKLYDLLHDCYYNDEKSVYWHDHGRSFIVIDTRGFAERVMKKYFKLTQYASFLRQLSLYGFKRLEQEPDKAGYYHPKFLRGKRFLAQTIKRPSATSSSTAKDEDDSDDDEACSEPNLRDYPSMPQLPPRAAAAVSEHGDDTGTEGGQGQRRQRHKVGPAITTAAAALSVQNDAHKHQRKRKNRSGFSQVEADTQKAKARRKSLSDQYSKRQQGDHREDNDDVVQRNRLSSMQSQLQSAPVQPPCSAVVDQAPPFGSPPCPAPQVVMASPVSANSFAQSAHPALMSLPAQGQVAFQPNQQPPSCVTLTSSPGNGPRTAPVLTNQAPPSPVQITSQETLYQSFIQHLLQQVIQTMASGESLSQGQNTNQDVARGLASQILQQQPSGSQGQIAYQDTAQALTQILEQAGQRIAPAVGQSTASNTSTTSGSVFQLTRQGAASQCQVSNPPTEPVAAILLQRALGQSAANSTTTTNGSAFQGISQGPASQCQASNQAPQPVPTVQLQQLLQLVGVMPSTESQVPSQTANQPVHNLQGLMQALSSQGTPANQGPDQGGVPLQQFLQISQQPRLPNGGVHLSVAPNLVNTSQVINQVPLSCNQTTNQNPMSDSAVQLLRQVASAATQSTSSPTLSHQAANNQPVVNQVTSLPQGQNTLQGTAPEVGSLLQQLVQQLQQAGTSGSTLQG